MTKGTVSEQSNGEPPAARQPISSGSKAIATAVRGVVAEPGVFDDGAVIATDLIRNGCPVIEVPIGKRDRIAR